MTRAKLIALAVLIVLLLIVVFQNTAETTVRLLVVKVTMPLSLLLGAVLAGGVVCGILGSLRLSAKPKDTGRSTPDSPDKPSSGRA